MAHCGRDDTELLLGLVVWASAEQAQRADRDSLLDPIDWLYQEGLYGLGLLAHGVGGGSSRVVFELDNFLGDLVEQTERLILLDQLLSVANSVRFVGCHTKVAGSCQYCLVVYRHASPTGCQLL